MIETKDLILDKPKYADWESMYLNIWSRDESAKYMLWNPIKTEEAAKIKIEKSIEYMAGHPESYFVYEKVSGEAIGFAGMQQIDENTYKDTGIAIGPEFVGKGYGKQILMALVEQAGRDHGASKFFFSCRSGNLASERLANSCGFKYTHSEERTDPTAKEGYILDFYELEICKEDIRRRILIDEESIEW